MTTTERPAIYIERRGESGNPHAILAEAQRELRETGNGAAARNISNEFRAAQKNGEIGSYEGACAFIERYVEIVWIDC